MRFLCRTGLRCRTRKRACSCFFLRYIPVDARTPEGVSMLYSNVKKMGLSCNIQVFSVPIIVLVFIIFMWGILVIPLQPLYYTPADVDSWTYVHIRTGQSDGSYQFFYKTLFGNHSRVFKNLPYLIGDYFDFDGFMTIKLILFALGLMTSYGIFKLFSLWFNPAISLTSSIIFTLFHSNGAPFWLGAFGVNMSVCFIVWAGFFILGNLERKLSNFYFFIGLIFLFIANRSYTGHILLPVSALSAYFLCNPRLMIPKMMWVKIALILLTCVFSLWQVVYELFYTNQRIAQIADFDIYGLIPGFLHALHASTVEALYSVFFSPLNWPFLSAIFSVTLFFVVMILYKIDNFNISDRVRNARAV